MGADRYPQGHPLLIEADAGGCNGHRPRVWKYGLQQLANETGLTLTVCHYPTGASKWNPIEHQLFRQISRNWAGSPLRSYDILLGFIRGTSTDKGLTVDAVLDTRAYEKGVKIKDKTMKELCLKRQRLCPNLNYTISPQIVGNN